MDTKVTKDNDRPCPGGWNRRQGLVLSVNGDSNHETGQGETKDSAMKQNSKETIVI